MSIAPASASLGSAPVFSRGPGVSPDGGEVITLVASDGEGVDGLAARLAGLLSRKNVGVLMVITYGDAKAEVCFNEALAASGVKADWPVLWVEGASCGTGPVAGMQAFVVPRAAGVMRLREGGRVVASVWADRGAKHCLMAGIPPRDVTAAGGEQTREVIEQAAAVLQRAGFSYGDVARTWFYNDELLTWYNEFNRARTAFYSKQRFACGSLPASTCVAGRNPFGAALAFAAWATIPTTPEAAVREVASPLQCPAPAYGSSFSRATEIRSGGLRRILVSGTASIEPGGRTVWQGDTRKQIGLSLDVVGAILSSQGMEWNDVTRASAYFKHAGDWELLAAVCAARGMKPLPAIPVWCDICRDDLLFEIELDACRAEG